MCEKLHFLLVLGLAAVHATELGLEGLKPSELKEIEKEIAAGNVPPNYTAEKPKRGVPKLTNTDSPTFNYLSSSKPSYSSSISPQSSYSVNSPAYSTSPQVAHNPVQTPSYSVQPSLASSIPSSHLRLVYSNQQYVPQNQYLSYLQNPQVASQIAQYYQPAAPAAPHYLQTPTQIQYVSPPNYQNVPSAQFKTLTSKTPVTLPSAASQSLSAQQQPTTQAVHNTMVAAVPSYQQQPFLMYIVPQHQQQALYQQQQGLYYPGQHQMLLFGAQNPYLSLYNTQHRFALPSYSGAPSTASQLAYLQGISSAQQQLQAQASAGSQESVSQSQDGKLTINVPETASSNSYGIRTKA